LLQRGEVDADTVRSLRHLGRITRPPNERCNKGRITSGARGGGEYHRITEAETGVLGEPLVDGNGAGRVTRGQGIDRLRCHEQRGQASEHDDGVECLTTKVAGPGWRRPPRKMLGGQTPTYRAGRRVRPVMRGAVPSCPW